MHVKNKTHTLKVGFPLLHKLKSMDKYVHKFQINEMKYTNQNLWINDRLIHLLFTEIFLYYGAQKFLY